MSYPKVRIYISKGNKQRGIELATRSGNSWRRLMVMDTQLTEA